MCLRASNVEILTVETTGLRLVSLIHTRRVLIYVSHRIEGIKKRIMIGALIFSLE